MQRKALNTIFDRLDWPLRWFLQKLINLLGLEQHGALEAMRCKARIDTWYDIPSCVGIWNPLTPDRRYASWT